METLGTLIQYTGSEKIYITLSELLSYRRATNKNIYVKNIDNDNVEVFVQAEHNILLSSVCNINDVNLSPILPYCNKVIPYYDKRVTTHSFTDNTTWENPAFSNYIVSPNDGQKFIITYIQVRFPKTIKLKHENKLYFSVNLWVEAYNAVVPVIYIEYASLKDLVRKTNTPVTIPIDIIEDMSNQKIVELKFEYADPNNLMGSPITLNSSKGEYIEIGLTGNLSLKDINNQTLIDECWAVVNGKQTVDF